MTRRSKRTPRERVVQLGARDVGGAIAWADAAWNPMGQLDWPLRWRGSKAAKAEGRPSRIFVKSDLFERISNEDIAAVFGVMAAAPQHTFQVLSKRPERMKAWHQWIVGWSSAMHPAASPARSCAKFADNARRGSKPSKELIGVWGGKSITPWPLPNVWLGVPVEDQPTADERIPLLLLTPAAKRFVLYKPALGPVDFRAVPVPQLGLSFWNPLLPPPPDAGGPWAKLGKIDWMMFGGDSGAEARRCDMVWAREARDQCRAAKVPFFMEQLGALPIESGCEPGHVWVGANPESLQRIRHPEGGDPAEWPSDLRVQETP